MRIDLKELTVRNILGIASKTYYNKMNGDSDFTLCELIKMKEHYHCSLDELIEKINDEREKRRKSK